ncbi:EAL domain-containing protein [Acrocarpospora phusangensis]|uniref:EAL domain-containing protein n=1 Tax=Acrocarpospora phusangensis TaxID=1070424 RepID=UPI001EF3369C|nr:EAL domain-containing protein [Acrocarpospora phusangensis]
MSVPIPLSAPVATSPPAAEHSPSGPFTVSGYIPAWSAVPANPAHEDTRAAMPSGPATVYTPVVDLDSGGVIAVQVTSEGRYGADPADITATVNAVQAATTEEARLPLVLSIPAAAVVSGSAGLAPLHEAMRAGGRRPREVILVIEGDLPAEDRSHLLTGVDGLRAAGYLIAFGGLGVTHLPLDLLADASPYVIVIAPQLVDRIPRDARRGALAESLVTMARGIGAHVLAPGIRDESQLGAIRGWGIRLAQGPLLAPHDWKPSHGRVHVPVPIPEASPVAALLGPRVQEFLLPAMTLAQTASAEDVVAAFGSESSVTSVVLVDEYQRPQSMIDRSRFLLFMAGAYGHALHAKKPAHRIADSPRLVPKTTPAIAAMQLAGRETERVYDDLVVVDEVGRCLGIVHVSDLIRHVANNQAVKV